MAENASIQDRISQSYPDLSDKLKLAATYVANNPVDIATRSLRSVAGTSGVSPATFSRLARALGYDGYEEMREDGRRAVERKMSNFAERAHDLQKSAASSGARAMLHHQVAACAANIQALNDEIDPIRMEEAAHALRNARSVLLVGAMGSAGLIDYFSYLGQWFNSHWKVAGRNGTELPAALARLGEQDVVFAVSKAPYSRRTISALQTAKRAGATTIAVTDSRTSPALQFADFGFSVPTDSPQFFSSYAATLVFVETIISMLLARAGPEAENMIRATEVQIERLGENWAP